MKGVNPFGGLRLIFIPTNNVICNIVILINNVAIAHFEAENIADLEIEDKINFFLHQISSYLHKQSFVKKLLRGKRKFVAKRCILHRCLAKL